MLSFWLAYILTRPLGANLGDWLGFPTEQQGLGLGTAITSVIFLTAILATVVYLTLTRADVIAKSDAPETPAVAANPVRERIMLAYFAAVTVATGALLVWAAGQPHSIAAASEKETGSSVTATLAPGQSATANFPPADVANFRAIVADTLSKVQAGDQAAATARIKDLETAWDDNATALQALNDTGWNVLWPACTWT